MKLVRTTTLIVILSALAFAGCISNSSAPDTGDGFNAAGVIGSDYRNQGTVTYDNLAGKLISSTGCEVAYTYLRPKEVSKDVMVVLGHGFKRSKRRMAYLAQHLASWGLSVVSVEFCNSKWWAGHHDHNGADMVAVSRKLQADKVIYVGFSAGGLAAMLAANLDINTLAFLGLDMVDNKGIGKKIAPQLTIPFYGLVAAPSACNANNNGLDSYATAPYSCVIKVEDASHCHFEFPVDGKCSLVCGKGEKLFKREVIQQTILGLTTAFLLWQTAIDTNGENWWSDSKQNYKTLLNAGYIKKLINDETG